VADRELTGVLLVGGSSTRFGSPKALARLGGETLAERAWRTLGRACDERLAVGKTIDELPLPFPVVDDGSTIRAPLAGVVAGLRAARTEVVVFLPVDCPLITAASLRALGREVGVPSTGPLPGAYPRAALPILERRLAARVLELRGAVAELGLPTVAIDPLELVNVNEPRDLAALDALEQRAAG
jgi:molybdopterin-guanine dinucleotide biosynthesis protein A